MYRFFGKRYSKLILAINGKKNLHDYSKHVDMTTSHLTNVISHWVRLGLIEKLKKGKEFELQLTEKGKEWKELICKFDEMATELSNKIKNGR